MAKIDVNLSAREKNDLLAGENREQFKGIRVFNMIGSPGAGKTALLEAAASRFGSRMAVIEGDVKTDFDAERIRKNGSHAVQIETGGGCHLNAGMVQGAFKELDTDGIDVLIIENVGNLVCPSSYDLGEMAKIAVTSTPEGDEKPAKYPALFIRAEIVVINKIDLADILDYDIERVKNDCRKLNPDALIFEVSAKTGEGMDALLDHLEGTA